jgi:hypothetical protein
MIWSAGISLGFGVASVSVVVLGNLSRLASSGFLRCATRLALRKSVSFMEGALIAYLVPYQSLVLLIFRRLDLHHCRRRVCFVRSQTRTSGIGHRSHTKRKKCEVGRPLTLQHLRLCSPKREQVAEVAHPWSFLAPRKPSDSELWRRLQHLRPLSFPFFYVVQLRRNPAQIGDSHGQSWDEFRRGGLKQSRHVAATCGGFCLLELRCPCCLGPSGGRESEQNRESHCKLSGPRASRGWVAPANGIHHSTSTALAVALIGVASACFWFVRALDEPHRACPAEYLPALGSGNCRHPLRLQSALSRRLDTGEEVTVVDAMRLRVGQRVISAAGGWRSGVTRSPPRVSFPSLVRDCSRRPPPNTRVSFGTSTSRASSMWSAKGNAVEKTPDARRHNAWIGSAGAAGHDLRSQFQRAPFSTAL